MATDLITKLEEAGEGSRELDCRIHALFDLVDGERWTDGDLAIALEDVDRTVNCPHYTASVDAALALASRVLPGWHVTTSTHRCLLCDFDGSRTDLGPANATISQQMDDLGNYDGETAAHKHASTPALALCAAILRASEEKQS